MSTRPILRGSSRRRHAGPTRLVVLGGVLAVLSLGACAPRQAIVESEPGRTAQPADEATLTTLRADLRELADAQEVYRSDNGYYAARLSDLGWTASGGVRVDVIQGDRTGWSAVASSGDAECAMYAGSVRAPRGYVTEAGRVACR